MYEFPSPTEIVSTIEEFCEKYSVPPSRLCKLALGTPDFLHNVRNGQNPRVGTVRKLYAYMSQYAQKVTL